jgi:hypothetical protein
MPGRAYLIVGDIEGKLNVLPVECTKYARKGLYRVSRLIEKYVVLVLLYGPPPRIMG